MKATIWISGRMCRVLIQDAQGFVIDTCENWNNRASAEMAVLQSYPEAEIKFISEYKQAKAMDQQWKTYVLGNG